MKYSPIYIAFFIFYFVQGNAQRLSTPREVLEIMEKSEIKYIIDTLRDVRQSVEFTDDGQRKSKFYRVENELETTIKEQGKIPTHKKVEKYLKKGDKLKRKGKQEKAIKQYNSALDYRPSDTRILNRITAAYIDDKDFESAIYWASQALDFNPIDTEAHLKLAYCHSNFRDTTEALQHITLAHLFNRNNAEIKKELVRVYNDFNLHFSEKNFEPNYLIESKNETSLNIYYGHSVWLAYANVKAIWNSEPQYALQMSRISSQSPETIQEKEAIMNALLTYDAMKEKGKEKKFPFMAVLNTKENNKLIDAFIHYEILGRHDPLIFLLMPKEELNAVKDYIINIRTVIE